MTPLRLHWRAQRAHRPRLTVCVSVDFDATSFWFMLGSTNAHGLSRGDFGPEVGAPRILRLLEQMRIQSTWFIPGHTIDNYYEMCAQVRDAGHEIANHMYLHEELVSLPDEDIRVALRRGSDAIERLTGQRPFGFRPTGDYRQSLLPILYDEGFTYCSSLYGEHFARWARSPDLIGDHGRIEKGRPLDLVELPLNITVTDLQHFEVNMNPPLPAALRNPRQLEEVWRDEFDYAYENVPGAYVMVVLHPFSIGYGGRMLMLERFLTYCAAKPRVRFATALTIADEFRSGEAA